MSLYYSESQANFNNNLSKNRTIVTILGNSSELASYKKQ